MKYLYLGAAILLGCLILCAVCTAALGCHAAEAAALLDRARDAALLDDYDAAEVLIREARGLWESRRGFFGMVLRHDEADRVNTAFHALVQYARNRCDEEFAPTCAELAAQVRHIAEMERPYYYNIL